MHFRNYCELFYWDKNVWHSVGNSIVIRLLEYVLYLSGGDFDRLFSVHKMLFFIFCNESKFDIIQRIMNGKITNIVRPDNVSEKLFPETVRPP
jgi:hypothetical protein